MRFLRRLRAVLRPYPVPQRDPHADLAIVRGALEAEARRLGRRSRLSLSLLMEFSEADLTGIDLHATLGHMQAQGEIIDVQEDSFGNLRFGLPPTPLERG